MLVSASVDYTSENITFKIRADLTLLLRVVIMHHLNLGFTLSIYQNVETKRNGSVVKSTYCFFRGP